jgi:anti-anti-sigma factor
VVITGEASFDQAEVLAGQLLRIRLERYSRVVCVLAELTFLISLAMGALVAYRRGLCRRGVEMRLTNLSARVWLALESAGLGPLLPPTDGAQPTPAPAVAMA